MRVCWVYSSQELTPRAAEVLSTIKNENGYEDVTFRLLQPEQAGLVDKVLVFGNQAPDGAWPGAEFVHTYSVAQIMAKANAVTVLTSSLQLYFEGKHRPGDIVPTYTTQGRVYPSNYGFDYDKPTAIDIETDGNLGKTHTPEEVRVISVALYQEGCNPLVWVTPNYDTKTTKPLAHDTLVMLREALPKFTKAIYHNGKFDTRVLNRVLGVKLCVWADTMLMHHVLNHAAGAHGLKELAQRYLGAPNWEEGLSKYTKAGGHYENIPYNRLAEYNGWDVYWTYQLWKLFEPQIMMDENNQMAYELEMSYARFLLDVEMAGIPFDARAADELVESNTVRMNSILSDLRGMAGRAEFNPNSPKQVKEVLSSRYGAVVESTSEAVLQRLIELGASSKEFCELLLEYRGLSKQVSTYATGWCSHARQLPGDSQLRVRPTFLVHGTSTGRLSSTQPNAQNVPRDKEVRKIVGIV